MTPEGLYGRRKMTALLRRSAVPGASAGSVDRAMRTLGLSGVRRDKGIRTTIPSKDGKRAGDLLDRDFTAEHPGEKMVSDITYIPTDEGWLYLAGVMDLCGRKMVGVAMGSRMTKQLVMDALQDAINHTNNIEGCILHSDRGSQYCSKAYQQMISQKHIVSSMSRKGNCWDNAPMESFWGTLKQEWLNDRHFRTRDEAKTAIFEYIWIFYNRKRMHSSIGYTTPEKYYAARLVQELAA